MRYGSYTSACLIAASICVAMGLRISSAMWPMTPNVRPIKAKDSSRARGELRSKGRRGRSPSGNLDLRGFEDPNENFVQLVNTSQSASAPGICGW